MVNLLISIIFILLCVIYIQYKMRKNSSKNLRYTYEKLENIVNVQTGEKLLVMTDDLDDVYTRFNHREIAAKVTAPLKADVVFV